MSHTLVVNEIFHSIQGESTHAGTPCAFIRLSGCNLNCTWCDTQYALAEPGRELPLSLILAAIQPYKTPLTEITGGEPLLQPATPTLARLLTQEGYTVLVETNGSQDISILPYPIIRIMDLKTPSSNMASHNRMENLAHIRQNDEIKMVITDRMDYEWATTIINDADYPKKIATTLLSPAQGKLDPATLVSWMLADKLPARLNLQIHKYIWPNQDRGV